MRILMISDVYFPRINGVSTSIETFRSELSLFGVNTSLIAPAYPQAAIESGSDIIRIPARYLPMDPEDRLMRRKAIRQWLQKTKPGEFDLVHIQTPFAAHYAGLEIARHLDIPIIASYHTYFEEYLHHYAPFLPRPLMRAAARRFSRSQCNAVDAIIVPSSAMATALRNYGINRPLHILPTGLPETSFQPGDGPHFRQKHGIAAHQPLLLFVGRVAHEKNIAFLLNVVDQVRQTIPDVCLLITGEGPAQGSLRKRVSELGLETNVRFLGYLDRKSALADCYCAANLFVFASRTETQGLVLLEAMAQGCPVLALAEMGTRDILVGAAGAEIAHNNVDDFASRTVRLLNDRAQRQVLSVGAIGTARTWSAAAMAQRLAMLYQELVAQHRSTKMTNSTNVLRSVHVAEK